MRLWLTLCLLFAATFADAADVRVDRFVGDATHVGITELRAAPDSAWQSAPYMQRQTDAVSYWRLRVDATTSQEDLIVALREVFAADLVVWMPPDYRPQQVGMFNPDWHQVGSRHRIALLLAAEAAGLPIYLGRSGNDSQPTRVSAQPLADYLADDLTRVRFTSFVLSSLLLLGAVAIVYALAMRRRNLLLFCVWIASAFIYVAVDTGEATVLTWPALWPALRGINTFTTQIGAAAAFAFTISFLDISHGYPRTARVMKAMVAAVALLALFTFSTRAVLPLLNVLVLALSALSLIVAALRARAGSSQGWFYLIGWGSTAGLSAARAWFYLIKQGTPAWLEWLHPLSYAFGALALVLATARAARYAEREMHFARRVARTDALTALPNRMELDSGLTELIEATRAQGKPLCLLFLDLDHFKSINDRFGHPIGDACLIRLGQILRRHVRTSDLIARYGGEEFVIVLEGAGNTRALEAAQILRQAVQKEGTQIRGRAVNLTVSIGVSDLRDSDDADALLARADAALYQAKLRGRNRVEVDFLDAAEAAESAQANA